MAAPNQDNQLASMAEEIFDLIKVASTLRTRSHGEQSEELTEAEFLALDVLMHQQPQTVGAIQKHIGVLPAQMSRLIRSLESKAGGGFVSCGINPNDRRKIDVSMTESGVAAHAAYRELRTRFARAILSDLNEADREVFMRILRSIKGALEGRGVIAE